MVRTSSSRWRGAGFFLALAIGYGCGGRTADDAEPQGSAAAPAAGNAGARSDEPPPGAGSSPVKECSLNECEQVSDCCSGVCHRFYPESQGQCKQCRRVGERCHDAKQPTQGQLSNRLCCSGTCSYDGFCAPANATYLSQLCGSDADCSTGFCWLDVGECLDEHCDPRVYPERSRKSPAKIGCMNSGSAPQSSAYLLLQRSN